MKYVLTPEKAVFNNNGVYFGLTKLEMTRMANQLKQAQAEHEKAYPTFSNNKHWRDNKDGTYTTTNRRINDGIRS